MRCLSDMRLDICDSVRKMDGDHLRCVYAFLDGMGEVHPEVQDTAKDIIEIARNTCKRIPERYDLQVAEVRTIQEEGHDEFDYIYYAFCLGFHRGRQAITEEHQGILEEIERIKSPEFLDLVKRFARKLGEEK